MTGFLDWLADYGLLLLVVVFTLVVIVFGLSEDAYDKEHCVKWERIENPTYVVVGQVAVPGKTRRCVKWDE